MRCDDKIAHLHLFACHLKWERASTSYSSRQWTDDESLNVSNPVFFGHFLIQTTQCIICVIIDTRIRDDTDNARSQSSVQLKEPFLSDDPPQCM